ncbi:MAG: hypothetical protein JWO31_312, partial [Phycisphaerales bacterium]|nr:hypothetical protein [Phycisphaerales bacterium]
AHFAFGAAAGAAYAATAGRLPGPPAVKGSAFGVGVWAASYLGWLPAVGLLPPATEESARRNLIMIGAHVVWGAAAGVLHDRIARQLAANTGQPPAGRRPGQPAVRPEVTPLV